MLVFKNAYLNYFHFGGSKTFQRLDVKQMSNNVISLIGDVFQREGGEVFEMRSPLFAFIQSTGVVTTITLVTTVRMMMIIKLIYIYIMMQCLCVCHEKSLLPTSELSAGGAK